MQDLEELKERLKNNNLRLAIDPAIFDVNQLEDLIARCESAEKDRDDWKSYAEKQHSAATTYMLQAMENGSAANAFESELKELREQKPFVWAWEFNDGTIGHSFFNSAEEAIDSWGPHVSGKPKRLYAAGGAQSRDSAEPVITDHEGRTMTYWGGKANANIEQVKK